ncbi:hypothetical protein [Brevundimonas subvibrioides]|uniref:Uncharacterized protein n=1 Tax=Brevundimonas subvibrioides (strain ATCC 15264 / DSM 4735 / LMG 14903 / NBRC 16000 / CB 81) TaxID=633149 RepID=D9QMP9_BRESC|nr:hypothetical protein [Brevundimonas subvibrioides]ADL00219.1 hypothetical protein Bresu_0905 [Brevundimonas subvibrioides ATCC 15264]
MTPTSFATIEDAVTRCQQGPVGLCATLSVEGDDALWVQYVDGQANMASHATDWPDGLVASLGGGTIVAFEPRQYLTVDLAVTHAAGIARWIEAYFTQRLGVGDDAVIVAKVEQI